MKISLLSKKILLSICVSCISLVSIATEYSVSITLKGFVNQPVLIAQVKGDLSMFIDTVMSDINGTATAKFNDTIEAGMYAFVFPKLKNAEVPFIFNKENIQLISDATSPKSFVTVVQSKENDLYYTFMREQQILVSNIGILEYSNDNYSGTQYIEQTQKEYLRLYSAYEKSFQEYLSVSKNLYVSKIIRSSKLVVPPTLLNNIEKTKYIQSHYFDFIDFADTTLFNTNVFTEACINYIKTFSSQYQSTKSNAIFKSAVDTIFIKTTAYPKTLDFVTDYLLNGFESMGSQEMMQYISDKYLQLNSCEKGESASTLQHKALSNTELAIGKPCPKFTLINEKGTISSVDIKNEPTVIVFWASWCGHCNEMMPKILKDYTSKKNNFVLTTVSIDENTKDWEQFIKQYPEFGNSINFCDGKSWDGDVAQAFHVYATPTIFIIKDGIIVGKPIDFEGYKKQMQKLGL